MTNEIKQRIEQIKNGDVPKGYSHTNMGIFPVDWSVVSFDDKFNKLDRKNDEDNQNVLTISAQQGLISQQDYYNSSYSSENKKGYSLLYKGDFSYNKSYSGDYLYGAIKRLDKYEKGIVSPLYICFEPKVGTNSDFYLQYFEAGLFNGEIYKIAQEGARNHGLLNVSVTDFFKTHLVNSSSEEQQKIAEILMQCDKVIELKQKRIDEEKRKKQAMLKKVFVNNNSIKYSLCNLCTTIIDGDWIESKDQSEDGIRLIQTGNIGVGRYFEKEKAAKYISDETFKTLNCTEVFDGDVLVSRLPDPIGRACMIRNLKTRAITAVDCTIMRFKEQLQAELFLQYATTQEYFNKLQSLAGGSTRTRISRKELEKLKVKLPKEDKRARLINDLFKQQDRILITLEKELEQWQQKKKSLMQLLLTGIVRVKV